MDTDNKDLCNNFNDVTSDGTLVKGPPAIVNRIKIKDKTYICIEDFIVALKYDMDNIGDENVNNYILNLTNRLGTLCT